MRNLASWKRTFRNTFRILLVPREFNHKRRRQGVYSIQVSNVEKKKKFSVKLYSVQTREGRPRRYLRIRHAAGAGHKLTVLPDVKPVFQLL